MCIIAPHPSVNDVTLAMLLWSLYWEEKHSRGTTCTYPDMIIKVLLCFYNTKSIHWLSTFFHTCSITTMANTIKRPFFQECNLLE